jgi:hypothetical protein
MDKCAFCGEVRPMCMGLEGTHFGVYKGLLYQGEHKFAICEDCWEKIKQNLKE